MAQAATGFRKFIKDMFTGPDGQTWAIGRVYSVPTLVTGLAIPIIALLRNQAIEMSDVGVLLAGVAGAVLLLVRGTKNVDVEPADMIPPKGD